MMNKYKNVNVFLFNKLQQNKTSLEQNRKFVLFFNDDIVLEIINEINKT